MRTFLVYVKLELKRALRFLLWIAAGAMVLAGLLGSIALFAFRTVESGAKLDKLKVGVVVPEEDGLAKKAVSMLGTLDSVESICQFVFTEEADGKKRTEAGEFACLMEVPEDFVGSIIDGSNHPVTIWFPRPLGVEEQVFKELAEAGARTLSSAQAGIYAAGHMNGLYGIPASIQEAERYLNTKYLSYSLDREGYFRRRQVSSAGDVSTEVHYMAAAAVFFLLLSGIPAGRPFCGRQPFQAGKTETFRDWNWKPDRGKSGGNDGIAVLIDRIFSDSGGNGRFLFERRWFVGSAVFDLGGNRRKKQRNRIFPDRAGSRCLCCVGIPHCPLL